MKKEEVSLTEEEIKREMLEHLEKKYNTTFDSFSIEYASWQQKGQDTMFAFVKGENPYRYFPVYRKHHQDGSITYEDGYIGFRYEEVFIERVKKMLMSYLPDSVILFGYGGEVYPETMPVDISIEEFQRYMNKKVRVSCGIYVDSTKVSKIEAKGLLPQMVIELQKEFAIGGVSISGYSSMEYQNYILEDKDKVLEKGGTFTDIGKQYVSKEVWGEIDTKYQYSRSDT